MMRMAICIAIHGRRKRIELSLYRKLVRFGLPNLSVAQIPLALPLVDL
jgi:hypothetical protein